MRTARVAAVVCALFLAACGGGGGGGGSATDPAVAALQGTWNGTIEDTGTMNTVRIVIGGAGNITQVVIGVTDIGVTGSIGKSGTNLFSFSTTDGTVGGFFADATGTHAAFVTDDVPPLVGVVQKTAAPLPAYAAGDIVNANWTGYNVDLDANLNVVATFTSSAAVANDATHTFSGTTSPGGGGAFTGSLPTTTPTLGRWTGTFSQPGLSIVSGTVHAFLSIDKKFAGAWACATATLSLSTCTFIAWSHP